MRELHSGLAKLRMFGTLDKGRELLNDMTHGAYAEDPGPIAAVATIAVLLSDDERDSYRALEGERAKLAFLEHRMPDDDEILRRARVAMVDARKVMASRAYLSPQEAAALFGEVGARRLAWMAAYGLSLLRGQVGE